MKVAYLLLGLFSVANAACDKLDVIFAFPGAKEARPFVQETLKKLSKHLATERTNISGSAGSIWRIALAEYMDKPGSTKNTSCMVQIKPFERLNYIDSDKTIFNKAPVLEGDLNSKLAGYDALALIHHQISSMGKVWKTDPNGKRITLMLGTAPFHKAGDLSGKSSFRVDDNKCRAYDYASPNDVVKVIQGPLIVQPVSLSGAKDSSNGAALATQATEIKYSQLSIGSVATDPASALKAFQIALRQYCGSPVPTDTPTPLPTQPTTQLTTAEPTTTAKLTTTEPTTTAKLTTTEPATTAKLTTTEPTTTAKLTTTAAMLSTTPAGISTTAEEETTTTKSKCRRVECDKDTDCSIRIVLHEKITV